MEPNSKVHRTVNYLVRKFDQDDIEQLFQRACQKLSYVPLPADQLREILQCFSEYRPRPEHIDLRKCHRNLICLLLDEFQIRRTGIASWSDENRKNLKLLNGRYVVEFKRDDTYLDSLILHDSFYGMKRELKFVGDTRLRKHTKNKVLAVDSEHIILFDEALHRFSCSIFLVHLNLEEQVWSVKFSQSFAASSVRFVLDLADRRQFAAVQFEQEIYVQTGQFRDSGLHLNAEKKMLDMSQIQNPDDRFGFENEIPYAFRLTGNKLHALSRQNNDQTQAILRFLEFDLSKEGQNLRPTILFSILNESAWFNFGTFRTFWHLDKCYMASEFLESRMDGIHLIVVDEKTQKMDHVLPHFVGLCTDLHIGDDGQLSTMIASHGEHKFVLHRTSLSSAPDTLSNLVMLALGRRAKKCKNRQAFEQLISNFPYKFRPFYIAF